MNRFLISLLGLFLSIQVNAQVQRCNTMSVLERQLDAEGKTLSVFKQQFISAVEARQVLATDTIYIPVVVHVVYKTGAQRIGISQINSQLRILNEDFQKLPGTKGYNTHPVGANTRIRFVLAKRDPDGNATTGITYTSTSVTEFSDDDFVKFDNRGGKSAWPRDSYLNLWVCNLKDPYLGYSSFPGQGAAVDGVVCDYQCFGDEGTARAPFNLGRTATHEIGHWLGLFHIWGDDEMETDMCSGSDLIDDTPNQSDATSGCPSVARISCNNGPAGDMYQNYMDYTDDACMNIFTQGQSNRMRSTLLSFRLPLLSSNALLPVGISIGSAAALKLYPNPASDHLQIMGIRAGSGRYVVSDPLGRVVAGGAGSGDGKIMLDGINDGFYHVQVIDDDGRSYFSKLIIRK